jgi:type IV secretion system protein VirB5
MVTFVLQQGDVLKRYIFLLSFLLTISLPLSAHAEIDISGILSMLSDIFGVNTDILENNVDQLTELTDLNQVATDNLNELKNDLTGKFGHGNLTDKDLAQYTWSNDSWESALSMSNKSPEFRAAQQRYADMYETPKEITGVSSLTQTQYQQSRDINRAALASSSYSYTLISEHAESVKNILAKLEAKDKLTEKEAVDLNARLIAELCFIQLEMLKQQNIQTQLVATFTQTNVNSLSEESQFLAWNKS